MKTILICLFIATVSALPLREQIGDMIEERGTGNVRFYLYTRSNPTESQELFMNDVEGVAKSNFSKTRHTKIIIHGWGGSLSSSINRNVRDAYLSQRDYNIIAIDWNPYSKLNYISARNKVPVVGEDVGELVDFLHDNFGLRFDMLVVIGHSLGAHVAGFTGKSVKRGKVAAIVGLDPAFPLYDYENPATRLSTDDAHYVETIQTNGNMLGFLKPIGMASFYPNWGHKQPGCGNDISGSCSHGRCVTYYVESLKGYTYAPVYKCDDYANITEQAPCKDFQPTVNMGDPLQIQRVEGIYYLETSDQSPYGNLIERM